MMSFRKAERKKAKMRLGIVGPAGSGKTYGALLVAFGLGERIAMIDTENGSGDLYSSLGDYDICPISAPYTVQKYLAAIGEAERAGYDVLIIDSLSHAWAGEGGLLDQQGKIADSGRGNSYTAWRQVTPLHNQLVEAMLRSPCHIIATMRAKTEYVLEENERGKKEPRKVGMAPVQRDGMDYEFGVVFDLSHDHNAHVSKDRTSLFDGQIVRLGMGIGEALRQWMDTAPEPIPENARGELWQWYLEYFGGDQGKAKEAILALTGGRGSKDWTQEDIKALYQGKEQLIAEGLGEAGWADEAPPETPPGGEIIPEMVTVPEPQAADPDPQKPDPEPAPPEVGLLEDVKALLGEGGLGLTGADADEFIYDQVKKVGLNSLTMAELLKVKKAATKALEKKGKKA